MKKILSLSAIALTIAFASTTQAQNVAINTTGTAAVASAMLDITATNAGLLIPRVALTATNAAGPITAPATSLLVYNTATAGASPNNVLPGYYYWDGAAWNRLATGNGTAWQTLGNAGTVAATNFIGTTDAIDFVTRTNNTEKMRVTSAGNVGIGVGMTAPANKVDIATGTRSGTHSATSPLYVTGAMTAGSAGGVGVEFRHDNGSQGVGIGFNTVYATGSNAAQDLGMASRGTGNLVFSTNGSQRMTVLGSNGYVGQGVINPAYGLELGGTFGYGNGTSGAYRSRTETRDDAGQMATQSGFYETSAPVNYPAGASSWWHLLDIRHSNNTNNYALQIAGSFFDQNLWFRKTNSSGTQAWTQILTSSSGWQLLGNAGTNPAINFIGTTDAVDWVIRTSNTERARMTAAGNFGVGTATPLQRSHINGNELVAGDIYVRNNLTASNFIGTIHHGASGLLGQATTFVPNGGQEGLWIEGSSDGESGGLFFNGNTACLWSPGDADIFRIYDEDNITSTTPIMVVNGIGNVGISIAAPLQRLDVQGGNARINNTFIGDVGHGAGWGGWSHYSQASTTGYSLLASNDGNYTLINKQNTGAGYIGFRVANADVAVITNAGNMGVGTTAPSSRIHAVADGDNIPVIYGVNTNATAATTSFGVRGECGSTGLGSAGVSGVSTNSSQNEMGVLGDYALWGAGVFGLGWAGAYTDMPASRDFGVFGTVNFSTGTGVYGRNTNTTVGSAYGVYAVGNFAVTGAKAASVPTTKGNQLLYCQESPEMWFEDIGHGQLVNGQVVIELDKLFMETVQIDASHPMEVFIQENGESNGVYVVKQDGKFMVKEKNGGTSNIEFSYRIMAKRRFYEDHRFGVDANQDFGDNLSKAKYIEPTTQDPAVMKAFVEKAAAQKGPAPKPTQFKTTPTEVPVMNNNAQAPVQAPEPVKDAELRKGCPEVTSVNKPASNQSKENVKK